MAKWFVFLGIVVGACIIEWLREILTFRVTHYDIQSEKLDDMPEKQVVVFLTDLHNNRYGKGNRKLLKAVKDQCPDLILIGGDMLVGLSKASTKVAEDLVSELTNICPVYYANGNHEQRMKIYPETYGTKYKDYKELLMNKGVRFLENEHIDLQWGTCPVQIYGLEIPREGYKKLARTTLSLETMEACIGTAERETYQILLAHNPIYADTYLEWGADLVLSGHLHGGVVRIPKLGGVITPQFRLFPKYSGEHTMKDGKSIVVSKGLGMHTIKIRFLNPAELVVLHIGGTD